MKVEHKGGEKTQIVNYRASDMRITVENLAGTGAVLGDIVVTTRDKQGKLVKFETASGTYTF